MQRDVCEEKKEPENPHHPNSVQQLQQILGKDPKTTRTMVDDVERATRITKWVAYTVFLLVASGDHHPWWSEIHLYLLMKGINDDLLESGVLAAVCSGPEFFAGAPASMKRPVMQAFLCTDKAEFRSALR